MTENNENEKYFEKRLRYFDGQFLEQEDFVDEQKYHMSRRHHINGGLHAWGIIEGLNLNVSVEDNKIVITQGVALNEDGKLIVLGEDRVKPEFEEMPVSSGDFLVVVSHKEDSSDIATIGGEEDTRWHERSKFELISITIPDNGLANGIEFDEPGTNIPLGVVFVTVDTDGNHTFTENSEGDLVRVYAGVAFPTGDGNSVTFRRGEEEDTVELSGRLIVPGLVAGSGYITIDGNLLVNGYISQEADEDQINEIQFGGDLVIGDEPDDSVHITGKLKGPKPGMVNEGTLTVEDTIHIIGEVDINDDVHVKGILKIGDDSPPTDESANKEFFRIKSTGAESAIQFLDFLSDSDNPVNSPGVAWEIRHDAFGIKINKGEGQDSQLTVGDEKIIINSNVAIGKLVPMTELDVKGTVTADSVDVNGSVKAESVDVNGTVKANKFIGDGSNLTGIGIGEGKWTENNASDIYLLGKKVGVGTRNPLARLHITSGDDAGDEDLDPDRSGYGRYGHLMIGRENGRHLILDDNEIMARNPVLTVTDGNAPLHLQADGGDVVVHYHQHNSQDQDWQSATRRFVIKDSGNVGVGVKDPDAKLQVAGTVQATMFEIGTNDFAEYFESTNGKSISPGFSIVLEDGKIRRAKKGETPIGVISANPGMTGGVHYEWPGRYVRDEWGAVIMEKGKDKVKRPKINPEYDSTKEYTPRQDRPEWNCVGLLGQIPLRKNQPVADSWVKIKEISDKVELWLVK